ncbi:hypothetical protein MJ561_16860 [Klebsiella pneumoniae]|nr:hypothetical protein MJ561_16860 [Klebsiella pneumoniae]
MKHNHRAGGSSIRVSQNSLSDPRREAMVNPVAGAVSCFLYPGLSGAVAMVMLEEKPVDASHAARCWRCCSPSDH